MTTSEIQHTGFIHNAMVVVIAIVILMLGFELMGCATVSVRTYHGFMGPDVYTATDGDIIVGYYNGDCCCVAKEVLETLVDRANRKDLDWKQMGFVSFKDSILSRTCDSIRILRGFKAP